MRLACFFGCLLVVAPVGLAAQNASYGVIGSQITTLIGPDGRAIPDTRTYPQLDLCPVSVQASHLSDGSIVKAGAGLPKVDHDKGEGAKGVGQRLHLKLHSPDQRTISSATVNMRGWTAKGRTAQVGLSNNATLGVRALTVAFTPGTDHTASADVWVPGLTAVVSVELLTVKYSDGSMWTPAQGKTCRVAPEHLMLVTER